MKVDISYSEAQAIATGISAYLALDDIAHKYQSEDEQKEIEVLDFLSNYPKESKEAAEEAQAYMFSLLYKYELLIGFIGGNVEDEHSS